MAVLITWLGHASFRIRASGKTVYIDPYIGDYSHKADLILISHSHPDHCDAEKVKEACGEHTRMIAPRNCAQKIGEQIETLESGGEITIDGIQVKAVEAYNHKRFRSPGNPFHPRGLGVGYLISAEGKIIYHAGDTDYIPEMSRLGHVDVALLPTGGTYTMDNEEAAEAAKTINPEIAVPMHRWNTNPEDFRRKVEAYTNAIVVIPKKDEEFQVT